MKFKHALRLCAVYQSARLLRSIEAAKECCDDVAVAELRSVRLAINIMAAKAEFSC